MSGGSFAEAAARTDATLDELALALAAEFRAVDEAASLAELDRLGSELAAEAPRSPDEEADACRLVLGERHGFTGNRDDYDHPANSMLDLVLERRTGLPILLSVVYCEVARRAGVALAGVGLPGHYVVGHFGVEPPILLDPFAGGTRVVGEVAGDIVRAWSPHETALRMLNNLVAAYSARGDLGNAIRAADLRLALPVTNAARGHLDLELRRLRARLN